MPGVVGIDEAGRGPVLGPLVVAAVAVPERDALADLPLRDSKQVPADQRDALADRIRSRADVAVEAMSAARIDEARRIRSLNDIEVDLFAKAADGLDGRTVLADAADVDADRFGDRLAERLADAEVVAEHEADANHAIVSAASIVAKVDRDRRIREIADDLDADVGSGYPSDPTTRAFLRSWVADHGDLPPHTRRSWSSAEAVLAEVQQSSIGDY